MPWLYWNLKEKHKTWAKEWQEEWQNYLCSVETISIEGECFIAPEARLFAEPGRPIVIRQGVSIAADCVIHGPVDLGRYVSINHHSTMDGGSKGIQIGPHTRIAAYTHFYAFNHNHLGDTPIHQQGVTSQGITVGEDVWIGAHTGVCDGVTIGDKAIIGMNSTVTRHVSAYQKVAGSPAKCIGIRQADDDNLE